MSALLSYCDLGVLMRKIIASINIQKVLPVFLQHFLFQVSCPSFWCILSWFFCFYIYKTIYFLNFFLFRAFHTLRFLSASRSMISESWILARNWFSFRISQTAPLNSHLCLRIRLFLSCAFLVLSCFCPKSSTLTSQGVLREVLPQQGGDQL